MKTEKQLQALAVFSHGILATVHSMATLYHLAHKDREWKHVAVHGAGALYSILSMKKHLESLKEE